MAKAGGQHHGSSFSNHGYHGSKTMDSRLRGNDGKGRGNDGRAGRNDGKAGRNDGKAIENDAGNSPIAPTCIQP